MRDDENDWAELIELCWQTDPAKRPSFSMLARSPILTELPTQSEPSIQERRASHIAQMVDGTKKQLPWDLFASETEVTKWLLQAGLRRVIPAATQDEDYCDMDAFESMANDGEIQCARRDAFAKRMALSSAERELFLVALAKLKLKLSDDNSLRS